ncbi:polygalacturonase-like isoform X2 [Humulus lupulus]|uniref:polygalacturonase-like isoform X2 n=1 Tax=Humulus lupulus TaxID=3486 RepID=UPI002B40E482|nr:polygalacturonase-like isoform X2 [Humulus lupulus]
MYVKTLHFFLPLLALLTSSSVPFSYGQNQENPLAISTLGPVSRLSHGSSHWKPSQIFNVDDFGAKGDGTDDRKAFNKTWNQACSSKGGVFLVPNRTYLLGPMNFTGPCKFSLLTLKIVGTIEASTEQSEYREDLWHWLVFVSVKNLRVEGGGTFDGKGKVWWKNSCSVINSLAVTFYDCKNLNVTNLRFKDGQRFHLFFDACVNVKAENILVTAPSNSPNTDGIHMRSTQHIHVMNSIIKTGDDCISIINGSTNVRATDITCGPGHGISIGSLGPNNTESKVYNVTVDTVTMLGTSNGVRIKSWQGGSGYGENIIFQNIAMYNVTNPIIIDQYYCDQKDPCPEQYSAVRISNVFYNNITGSSFSKVAVKINCSKTFECQGISMRDVNLVREGDGVVEASCNNVGLIKKGLVFPSCS